MLTINGTPTEIYQDALFKGNVEILGKLTVNTISSSSSSRSSSSHSSSSHSSSSHSSSSHSSSSSSN